HRVVGGEELLETGPDELFGVGGEYVGGGHVPTIPRPYYRGPGRDHRGRGRPRWSRDPPESTGRVVVERVPFETIVYEKDGPVARIVLNVPEKANIQTAQQVWDMDEALELADRDDEVKVLILKANGAGFCAGHAIVGPDEMPEVYPTTGPTPERTWKHHHYGFVLWPPLRPW